MNKKLARVAELNAKPTKKKKPAGDPIMLAVAQVIADRTDGNVFDVNDQLAVYEATDSLYDRFIGPAIDQCQAFIRPPTSADEAADAAEAEHNADKQQRLTGRIQSARPNDLMDVKFIVKRSSAQEFTFAEVTAKVVRGKHMEDEGPFLTDLQSSLSEWAETTQQGREAWELSSHDFNVGDLSTVTKEETLVTILETHGLYDLNVETHVQDEGIVLNWNYDTILIDAPPPVEVTLKDGNKAQVGTTVWFNAVDATLDSGNMIIKKIVDRETVMLVRPDGSGAETEAYDEELEAAHPETTNEPPAPAEA